LAFKYAKRRRIFRDLRMARITPDELRRRIEAGDGGLAIIDTRSTLDVRKVPFLIPGAIWIDADEVDRRSAELPTGREIILYCT
jgi:rhodanese-related sulfurtransferase